MYMYIYIYIYIHTYTMCISILYIHVNTQGKAAAFRGLWMYGAHAACAHAPGVACHFHPHFNCPEQDSVL